MFRATEKNPIWRPAQQWRQQDIPANWRQVLLDTGSLTQLLTRRSGGEFAVHVLRQEMSCPQLNEAVALGLGNRQLAMVREVILTGAGQPWVFARSIVPAATLTGRLRSLRNLDDRPLGGLLFTDPTMTRGDIEVVRMPGTAMPGNRVAPNDLLWGRRSLFYLDGKPLLVCEFFLPDFKP